MPRATVGETLAAAAERMAFPGNHEIRASREPAPVIFGTTLLAEYHDPLTTYTPADAIRIPAHRSDRHRCAGCFSTLPAEPLNARHTVLDCLVALRAQINSLGQE